MNYELVIFDCDGVLVDSEVITNRIFAQMLGEIGVSMTLDEVFDRFVGRSMPYCWEIIAGLLGHEVPQEFIDDYRTRTAAALQSQLQMVPGVDAVIAGLSCSYCVASSGTHEKMQLTLGLTGLLQRFTGKIYSVTEVARSKPFPDVYLYAARQMGFAPSVCAVIEDSPTGVRAGVAAGMSVFGYCALTPEQRLREAGARQVFKHMRELPALLGTLLRGASAQKGP
jgi:HAD superfamily hydrolase (TIGR01509 family)